MSDNNMFFQAAKTTDIIELLQLVFPEEWQPVASRIVDRCKEHFRYQKPNWKKLPKKKPKKNN